MTDRDLKNILILKKFLPNEIIIIIESFIINYEYLKNIWQNRMIETLSILDKGYKFIPVYTFQRYNVLNNLNREMKYYCIECYLTAFIKKTSYSSRSYCTNCYQITMLERNPRIRYRLVSYDEIKLRKELRDFINLFGFRNIKVFLNSNKLLTERILLNDSKNYKNGFKSLLFLHEIKKKCISRNLDYDSDYDSDY